MTFTRKDLNLIRNNVLLNITENINEVNDTNVGSVLDMFVTALAYEMDQQYQQMQVIYDGYHIDTAEEYDLNQLGALIGLERDGGTEATGNVTFIRSTAAASEFTIPNNVIVTTQPTVNSTVYSFVTTAEATFPTTATDSQTYVDGIFDYRVDARLYEDMVIEISAVSFTDFTNTTNFVGKIIDTSSVVELNDCDSISGWTAGAGAAALTTNATYKIQGTNALNLIKTSTATDTFSYIYGLSDTDLDGLTLCLSIRTTAAFLSSKFSQLDITLGSGYDSGAGTDNNNYTWTITDTTQFTDAEFVRFFLNISDATVSNAPNITEIDFIKIALTVQNNSDTVSADEFVMDFWFASTYEDYRGYTITIDEDNKPTDGVTLDMAYVPLSVDVPAEAQNVGIVYNVGVGQITYLSSLVSNIDRVNNYSSFTLGTDGESDTAYRERIKTGAYVQATSSAAAIIENVKELNYIQDCIIIDMPETTVESEAHVYNDTTKEFTLDYFVAQDDATLLISDTNGGSADYTKDTDYELTADNKINWDLGGTTPTDTNTVYVDYNYNALGYFTAVVVGSLGYLTTTQVAEVTALIESIKSPGTIATVSQATYVQINATANITIDSSYDSTIVNANAVEAVEAYVTALNIGDDVLLSQITKVISQVDGVTDVDTVTINTVASNYTISTTQKAVPNIITLTEV